MENIDNVYKIIKITKAIRESLKKSFERPFKDLSLTATQSFLLGILIRRGPQKTTELSKQMGLSNSTVSGIIDRLELQGAIERTKDEKDKRIVWIDIPENYKIQMNQKLFKHEEHMKNLLKDASDDEIKKILVGLNTFKIVLERSNNNV